MSKSIRIPQHIDKMIKRLKELKEALDYLKRGNIDKAKNIYKGVDYTDSKKIKN